MNSIAEFTYLFIKIKEEPEQSGSSKYVSANAYPNCYLQYYRQVKCASIIWNFIVDWVTGLECYVFFSQ